MNQTEVNFAEQYMEKRAIQSGDPVQATVNNIFCETRSRVILTADIYNHIYGKLIMILLILYIYE